MEVYHEVRLHGHRLHYKSKNIWTHSFWILRCSVRKNKHQTQCRRCELTCAFTQSCFEALQETVEEQFSSGQRGCGSRWTVTLAASNRICWITAAQQKTRWTDVRLQVLNICMELINKGHQSDSRAGSNFFQICIDTSCFTFLSVWMWTSFHPAEFAVCCCTAAAPDTSSHQVPPAGRREFTSTVSN